MSENILGIIIHEIQERPVQILSIRAHICFLVKHIKTHDAIANKIFKQNNIFSSLTTLF